MMLIGFDIGGTKCAVSRGEAENGEVRIVARREIPSAGRWQDVLARLFDLADELLAGDVPAACGFSCGNPLDAARGVILAPPNLPDWDNVPVTELGRQRFGVPCFLENDANACALAEWRWGAGQGSRNMAFLTFGTGMGAGLIFDGRLARGANGNAGEVGHVRLAPYGPTGYGKLGSFEGFCSGGGVAQVAVTLGKQAVQSGVTPAYYTGSWDDVTTKSVAMAARAGDKTALAVFDLVGEKLGEGLSILTDIVNPEVIVIGSVFARCENLLRPAMERVMRRECLSASFAAVRVVPARLGESIGDCAALCVAEYGLAAAHDK